MTIDDRIRLQFEVERFYAREAGLLDMQRYDQWLQLVTDDIHYWAPAIESVERRGSASNHIGGPGESAYFNDSRATLQMRADRLKAGGAWAEVPPSRMQRFITNISVEEESGDDISATSAFMLFRSRLESEEDVYFGRREDILRRSDGSLRLARRKIVLAQSVLTARSITTFF